MAGYFLSFSVNYNQYFEAILEENQLTIDSKSFFPSATSNANEISSSFVTSDFKTKLFFSKNNNAASNPVRFVPSLKI
jgi:hypothetical protein